MDISPVGKEAVQLICVKSEEAYSNGNKDKWSKLRKEAKELLKSNGYKPFIHGDYRFVYKIPNQKAVLKITKSNLGRKENKAEVENYHHAPENIKEHLADILNYDVDGKWVIQTYIPNKCTSSEAKELSNKFKDNNYYIAEINSHNVGKTNDGKLVAFDYAGN